MWAPGRYIYMLEVMQARGVAWGLRDWLASCPHPGRLGSGGQEVRGEGSESGVRLGGGVGPHGLGGSGGAGCLGKTSPLAAGPGMLEPLVQKEIYSLPPFKALVAPELLGGAPRRASPRSPPPPISA